MAATILTVVGARPQFIKAAPVSRALRAAGLTEVLVHTGQHFDPLMSDIFFEELEMPAPAFNLDIHSLGHGAMTGRMMEGLEAIMGTRSPAAVLVYGDTNSTIAGALTAAKLRIPVAHVEAGLRSFNRDMPEEINRVATDHVSSLLFCPTRTAADNLRREGIVASVHEVGDVMYDSTIAMVRRAKDRSTILARLGLTPKGYAIATVHRAENTDDPSRFDAIMRWLEREAEQQPIALPAHPRLSAVAAARGLIPGRVRFIDPLGFMDMTWLVYNAAAVFTDSGGLQKEAYFHRVPCVTLRDETEWVETVEAGWNRLWTVDDYAPRGVIDDYGDGHAAEAIAAILSDFLTTPRRKGVRARG